MFFHNNRKTSETHTHILKDEVSSPLKRTMNQTTKVYPWFSQEAFPTLSPVSYSSQQAQMLTVIY